MGDQVVFVRVVTLAELLGQTEMRKRYGHFLRPWNSDPRTGLGFHDQTLNEIYFISIPMLKERLGVMGVGDAWYLMKTQSGRTQLFTHDPSTGD